MTPVRVRLFTSVCVLISLLKWQILASMHVCLCVSARARYVRACLDACLSVCLAVCMHACQSARKLTSTHECIDRLRMDRLMNGRTHIEK